ncbi:macrosialin isoform X2 [Dromiciops gliroides]|uniref:macrosialin isoform X2 n=1 Tax=Dromiciops gliroides TaxID=33562 RepID=UPI001CC33CC1|nr:macrosialin isoform X2 [Dromiciops gliroides]
MRLSLLLSGILLGLLAATERSTSSPETTSHGRTATTHWTSTAATSPHSNRTATTNPTTSEGTAITRGTTTGPRNISTISPSQSVPVPPSPKPTSSPTGAVGDYIGADGSQLCVRLRAQIQMRVLYQSHAGGKLWGMFVLNPNRTIAQGSCEGNHSGLILSFPDGKLIFGFKQDSIKKTVYLSSLATEFNVSFPSTTWWTFSAENSSLQDLQAPLGHSFSCRNRSIALSPEIHLDLLSLQLQAAQLPPTGNFGAAFSCSAEPSISVPLVVGLVLLILLLLVLSAFCITRRRPPAYQPL